MSGINYDLTKIRGIALDVDGVLSPSTIPMGTDGQPVRMVNIRAGKPLATSRTAMPCSWP